MSALCAPCADGEHGTVEDGRCTCCGAAVSEYDEMTDADTLREIGMAEAADDPTEPTRCRMCEEIGNGFGPSHDGSPTCQSGSLASGGHRSHCTCDTCF